MQNMEAGTGFKKRAGVILYIAVFLVIEIVFGYFIVESEAFLWKTPLSMGAIWPRHKRKK